MKMDFYFLVVKIIFIFCIFMVMGMYESNITMECEPNFLVTLYSNVYHRYIKKINLLFSIPNLDGLHLI